MLCFFGSILFFVHTNKDLGSCAASIIKAAQSARKYFLCFTFEHALIRVIFQHFNLPLLIFRGSFSSYFLIMTFFQHLATE